MKDEETTRTALEIINMRIVREIGLNDRQRCLLYGMSVALQWALGTEYSDGKANALDLVLLGEKIVEKP